MYVHTVIFSEYMYWKTACGAVYSSEQISVHVDPAVSWLCLSVQLLWQYKQNITRNTKFEMAASSFCQTDLTKVIHCTSNSLLYPEWESGVICRVHFSSVCMYVCLQAYAENRASKHHHIMCACCL